MSEVSVGSLKDIPAASGTLVEVSGTAVAVFRVDEDVYAIADRCSHAEASLSEGDVLDGEVECPRHGAIFDIASGAALTLPATKPVATYRAAVRDGEVFVSAKPREDVR